MKRKILILILILLSFGCNKKNIRTYNMPIKEIERPIILPSKTKLNELKIGYGYSSIISSNNLLLNKKGLTNLMLPIFYRYSLNEKIEFPVYPFPVVKYKLFGVNNKFDLVLNTGLSGFELSYDSENNSNYSFTFLSGFEYKTVITNKIWSEGYISYYKAFASNENSKEDLIIFKSIFGYQIDNKLSISLGYEKLKNNFIVWSEKYKDDYLNGNGVYFLENGISISQIDYRIPIELKYNTKQLDISLKSGFEFYELEKKKDNELAIPIEISITKYW